MRTTRLLAVAGAMALSIAALDAHAAVVIQGSGSWGATAPTTAYSAPNASFSFSFAVPDAFAPSTTSATTTSIANYSYTLNGSAVAGTPTSVIFYQATNGGMFDINYGSTAVSLYGADIGSNGVVGPNGVYTVTTGINAGVVNGTGTVSVGGNAAAVPEPASWAMMIAGAGLAGGALRRRRGRTAATVRYA